MRRLLYLWAVLAILVSLVTAAPGRAAQGPVGAGEAGGRAIEAGPEDGFLCCNGMVPFLFHGEQVLTSTGRAGVFRSAARGEHWQRSMAGLVAPNGVSGFVAHVCQAPSKPHVVYALADGGSGLVPFDGLFASEDFGRTWTRRASVATDGGDGLCAVDARDERTIYVTPLSRLSEQTTWRSTDGGTTFEVFQVPECAGGGRVIPRRDALYLDGGSGCRYFSTDGGTSFSPLPEPPSGSAGGLAVSPDGRTILISTFDASSRLTGIFRSTDRGASYVRVTGLPHGIGSVAFDPRDPGRIYASAGSLYASTDGGLTFTQVPGSDDPRFLTGTHLIAVDDRGSLYVDTSGGPFRSDDGGGTFRSLLTGFRASSVNDLAFDANGNLLVAVNNTRGLFQQTQGLGYRAIGDALPRRFGTSTVTAVAGSPLDPGVVVAATNNQGGVFRTDDAGRSWSSVSGAPARLPNARMAFPSRDRVYLVLPSPPAFQPGLYRSDDAGRSFTRLSQLRLGALAVDPSDPNVVFVGTYNAQGGLFRSTDGGRTLQDLGQPGSYSALLVERQDSSVVYAGQQFGQVLRSRDGGRSFAPASSGLLGKGVLGLAQDTRGTLFAWMRSGGLFASHDRASSWHPVDTGEALARSGVQAGRGALVAHPRQPGLLHLGNAGVIRVQADGAASGRGDLPATAPSGTMPP